MNHGNLLQQGVQIDKKLQSGLRVTVKLHKTHNQGRIALIYVQGNYSINIKGSRCTRNSAHYFTALVHVCPSSSETKHYKGVVVAPHVPRTEGGLYWGYTVRLASCLSEFHMHMTHVTPSLPHCIITQITLMLLLHPSCCWVFLNAGAVFTESPYEEGYDVTVGTSERGSNLDQTALPPFK